MSDTPKPPEPGEVNNPPYEPPPGPESVPPPVPPEPGTPEPTKE